MGILPLSACGPGSAYKTFPVARNQAKGGGELYGWARNCCQNPDISRIWCGSRDHPPRLNIGMLLRVSSNASRKPKAHLELHLAKHVRIRRSSSNASISREIVRKMYVFSWKEQGPLKHRLQRRLRYCMSFLLQSSLTRWAHRNLWLSGPERKCSPFNPYLFHDSAELLAFAQAGWAILPRKIIPCDHYKMCSTAGKWPSDISGSHVLRYLIGDVLLKRKSN